MKTKINIPRVADQSSRVAELEAKRDGISATLRALEAERQELQAKPEELDAPATTPAEVRLAELLGSAPIKIVPDRRTALADLAVKIRDARSAVDFLGSQIYVERARVEAVIRTGLAPEYRLRVRGVCSALKAVHAANLDLRALTEAMEDEGIGWSALGVIAPHVVGYPSDKNSGIAIYFREAVELGFIDKSEIPPELLP